ncbi:MAG: hypothetical protein JXQ72_01875 [Anaerolineae bacterium]|nr:hypothetical protein [Anaerolineae bacterium]
MNAHHNTSDQDQDFQLNFLFQTAAEGILVTQADGFLTRLNPAAAALLEIAPDDVLGEHITPAFKQFPDLHRLLNGAGERLMEVTLPHKRLATAVGVDRPGGGRLVLLHDVTERSDIDSRREVLVRQMAHDLRNPLNALTGYADLVQRMGDLNEKQHHFITRIQQTAQKLYELAETLVDLAWIEAGMAMEHKPFQLPPLVREAISDLETEAKARNVTLVFSLQDPVPSVMGDSRRIQQAIRCLIENGVRYSYPDRNVAIHAWQDGPKVYCSVGDRGIGIAEHDIDRIWDRMWRSSDDRVREQPGGGIGLPFARAIIERHGGQIWVESHLNVGTTVTFVLPLAQGW